MTELKTKPTQEDVEKYLDTIENPKRKADSYEMLKIMKDLTSEKPVMWGSSIIGFGTIPYKYASGREGEWMATGFAPRKQALTVYIMPGFEKYDNLLKKLGKFKIGKSCLYIKKLEDVDKAVLKELIKESVAYVKKEKRFA